MTNVAIDFGFSIKSGMIGLRVEKNKVIEGSSSNSMTIQFVNENFLSEIRKVH